jgi:hypothetical protein
MIPENEGSFGKRRRFAGVATGALALYKRLGYTAVHRTLARDKSL